MTNKTTKTDQPKIKLMDMVKDITREEMLRLPGVQERDIQVVLKYASAKETFASLGKEYQVSRERIRQMIARVCVKVNKARKGEPLIPSISH